MAILNTSSKFELCITLHFKDMSFSLLAPADPGGPGKMAVKRLWCAVVVVVMFTFSPLRDLVTLTFDLDKLDTSRG